jgi:hypothetical protein
MAAGDFEASSVVAHISCRAIVRASGGQIELGKKQHVPLASYFKSRMIGLLMIT